jgi:hypothetical protein
MPGSWPSALAAGLLLAAAARAQPAAPMLAPLVADSGPAPRAPWAYAGLPSQKPPPTRFAVVELEGARVLQVVADRSYGNLVHPLRGAAAGVLTWRWRVEAPLPAADLRSKAGDDTALKVCAMFDLPRERVPFVERQRLQLAEAVFGQALPTATLCYVWDPSLPRGSVLPNAHSRRLRFITLGGEPGRWEAERRELGPDFLAAFGDESREVPPLVAVAVGADADNTGGRSTAWLDALRHEPPPRP